MKTANGANITAYVYYNNGLLKKQIDPMEKSESFTYDRQGNVKTKVDRNGNTTTYIYDGLNRNLSQSVVKDGTTYTKSFVYGSTGGVVESKNNDITISYKINSLGLPKEECYTLSGKNYKTEYAYNNEGNVDCITFYVNNKEQKY